MRIIITDAEGKLSDLVEGLARNSRVTGTTLERVVALNPQLADAARVPAGSVLVLPDEDLKAGAGTVVGGATLTDLGETVGAGIRAAGTRAADRFTTLAEDRASVKEALKNAVAKRLVESDPLLAKQLEAAEARFKVEQKEATESKARFAQLEKSALAEFARLEKLLERRES